MSNQAKRLSDCPAERLAHCRGEAVPPAGDAEVQDSAKMEFDKLAHAHVLAICRGAAAACTEQHSYMQGAKTDSKNWLPHKWVIDAIRNLIGINQSTCLTLRDDTTRLQAEVSALQQRLNIADQRVCDLTWLAKSAYMEGSELGWVTRHTDANNEKRVTPWAPPREVMEREWLTSEGRAALNTTAPAAKVDCGNCAFVANVCLTECESKEIRDAQVKP